jgi:hypothetical protein
MANRRDRGPGALGKGPAKRGAAAGVPGPLTRRAFLADCAAGIAALATGAGLAACGQDSGVGPGAGEARPRVAWARNPLATRWDFSPRTPYFDSIDQEVVNGMMDAAIGALTRQADPAAAWSQVMDSYAQGDIVAVKINTNDANWGDELINAVSEVIVAVVRGLLSAGVPEERIHVYDAMRPGGGRMPPRIPDRTRAVYGRVVFLDCDTATWGSGFPGEEVAYAGATDHVVSHLCEAQHLISVPLLKAITPFWGVSGALKLHNGTIRHPPWTHDSLYSADPAVNAAAIINGNPHVRGKLRLVVADGLFGMDSGVHFPLDDPAENHVDVPRPWRIFGDQAANSLLAAFDPVAIDSVMQDLVGQERAARGLPAMDRPILQAAAAANLGVHESSAALQYRRIDLVRIDQ